MTDLPNVQPVREPFLRGNLLIALSGLEPGYYRVKDLHPRIVASEERMQNDAPSKIQVGMVLKNMGAESVGIHNHVKAWHVTAEMLQQGRNMAERAAERWGYELSPSEL